MNLQVRTIGLKSGISDLAVFFSSLKIICNLLSDLEPSSLFCCDPIYIHDMEGNCRDRKGRVK